LTLAMPLGSHADDIADTNWDLKIDKTTIEVPFQPSVTDTSAHSLRIRAETDSEPFTPFTPDASQTELGLELSPRQHTCSSSGEFEALQAQAATQLMMPFLFLAMAPTLVTHHMVEVRRARDP